MAVRRFFWGGDIERMYKVHQYYKEFDAHEYADLQTLYRWNIGIKRNGFENLVRGVRAEILF